MTPAPRIRIVRVRDGQASTRRDAVAAEEPLEIRVGWPGHPPEAVGVTMRTPGHDFELAAGYLHGEGVLGTSPPLSVRYCVEGEQHFNVVSVDLHEAADLSGLRRSTYASSACGVCGKAALDAVAARDLPPLPPGPVLAPATLTALPARLRQTQAIFARTGGLHAAALFTPDGELLELREDIGRHNAVDKVIGWAALAGRLPLHAMVLMVSGRAGFEIVQKAAAAGIPVLAAVSAPSSLAVGVAQQFGLTLVGFLRADGFNIYAGAERIRIRAATPTGPGGSDSAPIAR